LLEEAVTSFRIFAAGNPTNGPQQGHCVAQISRHSGEQSLRWLLGINFHWVLSSKTRQLKDQNYSQAPNLDYAAPTFRSTFSHSRESFPQACLAYATGRLTNILANLVGRPFVGVGVPRKTQRYLLIDSQTEVMRSLANVTI
jgi:hypothetical protein